MMGLLAHFKRILRGGMPNARVITFIDREMRVGKALILKNNERYDECFSMTEFLHGMLPSIKNDESFYSAYYCELCTIKALKICKRIFFYCTNTPLATNMISFLGFLILAISSFGFPASSA